MAQGRNIYVLTIDINGNCEYIAQPDELDFLSYYREQFVGVPLPKGWTAPPHYLGSKRKPLRDFVAGDDQAPYVSSRAVEALWSMVGQDAEFVSIGKIRGIDYSVMNVLRILDCLDRKESDIQFSSDDASRICNVWKFTFQGDKIPKDVSVFKVPEDLSKVFVLDTFVNCVLNHRLSGVLFQDPMNLGLLRSMSVVAGLPFR